jgi:DNA repair protein RadA/Sms
MRADRIGTESDNFYLLTETNTQTSFQEIKKLKPQLVIVDSIQTLQSPYIESGPGSTSQIRECAVELQKFAKETNTPVFLIGHITKDGTIAGPKFWSTWLILFYSLKEIAIMRIEYYEL